MVELKNYSKAFVVPYGQQEAVSKQDDSVYLFPNCKICPVGAPEGWCLTNSGFRMGRFRGRISGRAQNRRIQPV